MASTGACDGVCWMVASCVVDSCEGVWDVSDGKGKLKTGKGEGGEGMRGE